MSATGIVLYDFMGVPGGAEKLTRTLLQANPGAALCTGFVLPEARWLVDALEGPLVDLHAHSTVPALKIAKVIHAFSRRTPRLEAYDWALFSGSYAPVAALRTRAHRNVLYCHTPPRFCYDLRGHYRSQASILLRPALDALVAYLEPRYREAVNRMDVIVANSKNVQSRLARYLGRESVIVHPPIDTSGYRWVEDGDFYLSVARLEPLKRVGLLIDAFRGMPNRQLVVASGGSEASQLRQRAAGAANIRFTGWLEEEALQQLVGRCRAVLYTPVDEDFGMSPVEAMAAGKPVVGVAEGGLLETVVDGETGVLIEGTPDAMKVQAAVEALERRGPSALRAACERRAQGFGSESFVRRMHSILHDTTPARVG